MNRRLTDKLEFIRAVVAVPCLLVVLLLVWSFNCWLKVQPQVIHCRAPGCVIVALPDCDARATVTRYNGQDAVRVECR